MRSSFYSILSAFIITCIFSCQFRKHTVVYVNSYHKGYKPSDEILRGISENLSENVNTLKIFYIDSKRQTSPNILQKKVDSIRRMIAEINPDVLIVSDDYAVKHLVKPYFDQSEIPVVFCGVNWSLDQYSLSRSNVTGMIEVLPLHEVLTFIREYYPYAKKLTVLSENSLSEQNNRMLLDTLYENHGFLAKYSLADNFIEWKEMFMKANEEADVIYLPTNGAIKDWNDTIATRFVEKNIKKPLFTCDDFMMKYCVFGFTKVAGEQGEWAARATRQILRGISPSQIPVTHNKQSTTWFNPELAHIIRFAPDTLWLKNANIIRPGSMGN